MKASVFLFLAKAFAFAGRCCAKRGEQYIAMLAEGRSHMGITHYKLSELASMRPDDRSNKIREIRSQPLNGELEFIDEGIRGFEQRYEMSSTSMKAKLAAGSMDDTDEIGAWLMLLKARDGFKR